MSLKLSHLLQILINFQLQPNAPLPSPNALKNKILIKNKRLDPEKEKEEMEKFRAGKLNDDDGEKEDSASPAPAVISLDKKVAFIFRFHIFCDSGLFCVDSSMNVHRRNSLQHAVISKFERHLLQKWRA